MIDQIGGWSSGTIGEGYGEGFKVALISRKMRETLKYTSDL
jgi:hypothetical protein